MQDNQTTWWFWIPALPKWLIVVAWVVFWAMSVGAPYIRHLTVPGQFWWWDIWYGLGGNAIGIFTWTVIATQLTTEVAYMIFTFRANKRQVEEAAIKNREAGRVEGREEGYAERDAVWLEWVEQLKDSLPDDFSIPPGPANGASNGHKDE